MDLSFGSRLRHAWNAFLSREPTPRYEGYGSGFSYRPDRVRFSRGNERSIVTAVYNRIAMDVASIDMPVFIANGFYRNKTDFVSQHVVWDWRQPKYQRVERYLGIGRLIRLRKKILVDMDFSRKTISIHKDVIVEYDRALYKAICKERWNIWEERPIKNASEFCHALRRAVNQSEDRQRALLDIFRDHPRLIVFYNFDYELDILKGLDYGENVEVAEWNGHRHQPIPENGSWVYLVQYIAGAEGWNCILTDTIVFYSMNYGYRTLVQAPGRIDRLNTPFDRLYYYHLKSRSGIDLAIAAANREKKQFNEMRFAERGVC